MAGSLGYWQPFRYRGYVYDEETGLYYLRSRYFCPSITRFLNAECGDVYSNGYAYASNAPLNRIDTDGNSSVEFLNNAYHVYLTSRDAKEIFNILLSNNANNIYLAFHELAQIIAAGYLFDNGEYSYIELEAAVAIDTHFESDICCHKKTGEQYIYEVKVRGKSGAMSQIRKYQNADSTLQSGDIRIPSITSFVDVNYWLEVCSSQKHKEVIEYSWTDARSKQRVRNVDVKKYFAALLIGLVVLNDLWGGFADDFAIPIITNLVGF